MNQFRLGWRAHGLLPFGNTRFMQGNVCAGRLPRELERRLETPVIVLYILPGLSGQHEG